MTFSRIQHLSYKLSHVAQSKKLVIFVHGLVGSMEWELYSNAEQFFNDHEISTVRFNLYGEKSWEKPLQEVALEDHIHDINAIVEYFSEEFSTIILLGHSFGGLTSIYADLEKVTKLIFWDPSSPERQLFNYVHQKEDGKYYLEGDEKDFWISNALYEDLGRSPAIHLAQMKTITKPLLVLSAGAGVLVDAGDKYVKHANGKTQHIIIPEADHIFSSLEAQKVLFEESLARIEASDL